MPFRRLFGWLLGASAWPKQEHKRISAAMDAAHSQEQQPAVSDLAVAAQHADAELHSVTAQFSSAASVSAAPTAPAVADDDDGSDSESESSDDESPANAKAAADTQQTEKRAEAEDSDDDGDDPAKLRAEIEAAMEKEANKSGGPLTTENEVLATPVREPGVELTPDCPIAQCGTILNVSVAGLMMTIKSDPNTKPLDEGSVLCLEDRTVVGCVDEVFGPVLMPMYLVRFENAAKMPESAAANVAVYYATEHTTYIVPENIKDKGTDASNIFDEEADETEFSDDEAEAAAKRGNRKRNRGGAPSAGSGVTNYGPSSDRRGDRGGRGGRGSRGGNFTDYSARQNPSPNGGRGGFTQQPPVSAIPPVQTQPYGGATKYTQPGGFGGGLPVQYGNTKYTSPRGAPMAQPPYTGVGQQAPPARGYYPPPPPPAQYNAHNLPPYPPQAPPPQAPYQQYQQQPRAPYTQPPPPATTYGQPYAPPSTPYGQPQPPRYQPQHGAPPPPPPPPCANGYYGANSQQQQPRGPYDQRRYQ
ncbi:unnamed protein product [Phytophthora fragariaefolia]|uniref:H/ACA ribonucleoprotein complex non-core subunit NAF1 n=1 Tax=Phytophthora fragariaefolia TaxID=1490495 RepID=A0A9W6TYH2_9STRA|nr:unnamed protein product [Phytophthora fragariaefolia]